MSQVQRPNAPQRRRNRCGHCRQIGHNRQTCPAPEMVEIRRERNQASEARRQAVIQIVQEREQTRIKLTVMNENDYTISGYYKHRARNTIRLLTTIEPYTPHSYRTYASDTLYFFVRDELESALGCPPGAFPEIPMDFIGTFFEVGKYDMSSYEPGSIQTLSIKKSLPSYLMDTGTSVLNSWKECALKSHYLLKQMERLGAGKNPNLEPLVDMIQDINLPEHTPIDRERAGVPSIFTNAY